MNETDQRIAELIIAYGLRDVLTSIQAHCASVVEYSGEMSADDEFADYEKVGDGLQDIIDDLG